MRVLFITAGTHGSGHVVRGIALQRALARTGRADIDLVIAAPPSPFLRLAGGAARAVTVDASELRDPASAAAGNLARAIADIAPDLVVIDVFWVPLVFVPLPCPAWLLLRSVPPAWLVGPKEARFDVGRYERVIAIEPAPGLERFEQVPPVVVSNASDALSRADLAARLGVDVDSPLRVIVRGGLDSDGAVLDDAAQQVHRGPWHDFDLHQANAPFPVAPLLAGADHVVAAPGYNTFWESRLLGFAHKTTWVPIKRALDDAHWRAALPLSTSTANGADVIAAQMVARLTR